VNEHEVALKNPLTLAFVGDAVQTLHVRMALAQTDIKAKELHKRASAIVCATAQAKRFDEIFDNFTAAEKDIAMRARNTDHNTVPKSCTIAEYHKAKALEATIGYNYLLGNTKRVNEIIGEVHKC